jgi:hypothetical protein
MSVIPFQDWLVFEAGRRAAAAWWLGPAILLFAWAVVPIMRTRVNVLAGEDRSSARFWWAPGWGYLGVSGLGFVLAAAPVLDPRLAEAWDPALWPGFTISWTLQAFALCVALGLLLIIKGLLLYAHAWAMDRSLRYQAWRAGLAFRARRRPED